MDTAAVALIKRERVITRTVARRCAEWPAHQVFDLYEELDAITVTSLVNPSSPPTPTKPRCAMAVVRTAAEGRDRQRLRLCG
jgi:hypothetical protein